MKKEIRYNVGDKVFAKVKGYPPWPAMVLEETGKKYKVKFYGTNEIGQIKGEDLFYYTKNKHKFLKPIKRKDFNDSVEQIEAAIQAAGGTDGSPPDEISSTDTEKTETTPDPEPDNSTPKNKKRKRSNSTTSTMVKPPEEKQVKKGKHELESQEEDKENDTIETKESVEEKPPPKQEKPEVKFTDDDLIFEKDLHALVSYGEYVESNKQIYTKMPVEPRAENAVFPFIKDGKCFGIKLFETQHLSFENEYQRALYDKKRAEAVLNPEQQNSNNPDLTNIPNYTRETLEKLHQERMLKMKETSLEMLRTESTLTGLDAQIRACLSLDKAEPKEAVKLLEKMFGLSLNSVTLKKHSHVVDVARRLRKYVGNLDNWDMTDDEKENFRKDAEEVRKLAMKIFLKFMNIFGKPTGNETFWDAFTMHVEKFKEDTKDLSEFEFYTMLFEPNSRKGYVHNYYMKELGTEAFVKYANALKNDAE